jgi:hypothetical protein
LSYLYQLGLTFFLGSLSAGSILHHLPYFVRQVYVGLLQSTQNILKTRGLNGQRTILRR